MNTHKLFYLIIVCFFAAPLHIFAQNQNDALRYSRFEYGGTARFNAVAGAFGALGGDLSAVTVNPGGIAVFQKSEVTFSPAYMNNNSSASFMMDPAYTSEDYTNNLNINNAGMVIPFNTGSSAWKGINLGASYNRLANFNRNVLIKGVNPESSMADLYVWQANNNMWQSDQDWLPYDGYLVDYDSTATEFFSNITDDENYDLEQRKYIDEEGHMGEFTISIGANYNHVLFLGASIGFQNIRFNQDISYTENDFKDKTFNFISFTERENLSVDGSGFNFKFGMIAKPVKWIRIGAAFHSPTFLSLQETYYASLVTQYESHDFPKAKTGENYFEYEITTPARAIGSLAFMIGDKGFISAEYEYADYSKSRMRADQYDFDNENDIITNTYAHAHNLRTGIEYRIVPFSVRAGYAYYGSPYENPGFREDRTIHQITGGVGINSGSFYVDAAGVYNMTNYTNLFYDVAPDQSLVGGDVQSNTFKLIFTAGFRF